MVATIAAAVTSPWRAVALAVWAGAALIGGAGGCSSHVACISACVRAQELGLDACRDVRCSARFARCACAPPAALRADGLCATSSASASASASAPASALEEAPASGPCGAARGAASFDALFNLATFASPEIAPEDLQSGNASSSLTTLLHYCVGAALDRSPANVSVSQVQLSPVSGEVGGLSAGSILFFDLAFSFCAADPVGEVDPSDFEVRWRTEAQRYSAFDGMTLRLVKLTPSDAGNASGSTELEEDSRPVRVSEDADPGGLRASRLSTDVVIIVFFGVCTLFMLPAFIAAWWWRQRRHLSKVSAAPCADDGDDEERAGAPGDGDAAPAGAEGEAVLAHVACAFSPTDVEDDKVFRESCLHLQEGDLVEVVAGGGGWLYGRLLRRTDGDDEAAQAAQVVQVGYFPENRASWIGKIADDGLVGGPEQHLLVAVESGFSPADVEGEDGEGRENILILAAGEIVEVLAGAGGWLYGQVVGCPARAGYFPEAYASRLGACAAEGDAARTRQGTLVKVDAAFSPGSPGDPEEEVSFCESCIALAEGDVVEVAAAGGGWLYGRVVGAPERMGYFPETRISYLGRPVAAEADGEAAAEAAEATAEAAEVAEMDAAAAAAAGGGILGGEACSGSTLAACSLRAAAAATCAEAGEAAAADGEGRRRA